MSAAGRPVAVTGASGFLGRALLRALARRGVHAVAMSRHEHADSGLVRWHRGDLTDPAACAALVPSGGTVLHLGATLGGPPDAITRSIVDGTRAVAAAARAAGARMVHISSLSVLAPEAPDGTGSDGGVPPVDTRPELRGPYASAKILAELAVGDEVASGLDALIIRPAQLVGDGLAAVPPSLGIALGGVRWSLAPRRGTLAVVHVEDAAEAIVSLGLEANRRGVVHLADPNSPTRAQLLERLRGAAVPGASLPVIDVSGIAGMVGALLARLGLARRLTHRLVAVQGDPGPPANLPEGIGPTTSSLGDWLGTLETDRR